MVRYLAVLSECFNDYNGSKPKARSRIFQSVESLGYGFYNSGIGVCSSAAAIGFSIYRIVQSRYEAPGLSSKCCKV
jgi:hypothetical protein